MQHPTIIQGGMGVAVSSWRMARAVSLGGELGVVSGTLLAVVLARRLADGDRDGQMRRALAAFPVPAVAERILGRYFVAEGKAPSAPFPPVPLPSLHSPPALQELIVAACFAEVYLAKEGHPGPVGINLLEKIQVATLPSLFGAMLAGVDYVLMGAGIPRWIPGALDALASGQTARLRVDVDGAPAGEEHGVSFDPAAFFGTPAAPLLRRPHFLAVVSSATLAQTLLRKSNGRVDGFVIEASVAGGHNAPPRGPLHLNPAGEPVYGARDQPDLAALRALDRPFWLAGAWGRPGRLAEAQALGATGIQVGTPFAFSAESGLSEPLKAAALRASRQSAVRVFTDPVASPTGFPFKVLDLPDTLSQPSHYVARTRICDLGYLRQPYRQPDGSIGYRCPAEPVADYVRKGGNAADAAGRKCLCNGLLAAVGLPQRRADGPELPLVTAGTDASELNRFVPEEADHYSAADVLRQLRP